MGNKMVIVKYSSLNLFFSTKIDGDEIVNRKLYWTDRKKIRYTNTKDADVQKRQTTPFDNL